MKILCAVSETGSVKEVLCNKGTDTSKKDGIQPISIKDVCNGPNASSNTQITHFLTFKDRFLVASREGGIISIYQLFDEDYKLFHEYSLSIKNNDRAISLLQDEEKNIVIVAYQSGKIFLINLNEEGLNQKPIQLELPGGKDLQAFVRHENSGIFAYGGEENDLKIVQLFDEDFNFNKFAKASVSSKKTPNILFTAKNVKNDHLDMRVPISITDILFFRSHATSGYKLITSTKYGQVRIYETAHGKRPVKDFKITDSPIINIKFGTIDEDEIIVTNKKNLLAKFSLSKIDANAYVVKSATAGDIVKPSLKLLGKFSQGGNIGAVHGIHIYEQSLLSTGGLDRYLKVFDLNSREIIAKVYIGLHINDVITLDDSQEEDPEAVIQESSVKLEKKRRQHATEILALSDDENMWQELDNSAEGNKKKPRT